MKYLVIIHKINNNYGAYSPDVDGCVATGATAALCLKNMQEALAWHLEGEELPIAKGIDHWLAHLEEVAKPDAVLIEVEINRQEVLSTKEAFLRLLSQRGIYKKLNVGRSTVANWKRYVQNGSLLSADKMEEVLKKGGWQLVSQTAWQQPTA